MSEPKVTECWALPCHDFSPGCPVDYIKWTSHADAAILIWREDYDALRTSLKHREELYWKLTAEFDAMRKELEELRKELRIKALDEMVAISQEAGEYDDEEAK